MTKVRLIYLLFFFMILVSSAQAQENNEHIPRDTAEYPYWVEMMSDPGANYFQTVRAFELYWEGREVEKGSGYKPFRRWQFGTGMTIDENGNIPAPGSIEEKIQEYVMTNYPGFGGSSFPGIPNMGPAECLTNGNWVSIGPYSLASNRTSQPNGLGRLNAVAFHPVDSNIIYVGSPAGGLWSSTDGGKTWHSNTDTLPTLGVSAIIIDYQHPDTIYLGTGDRDASDSYGRGVIRSFDGGKTWHMSNTGMGNVIVGRMAIDPNNPAVILAATNAGLYRTINYGNSWSRVVTGNFKEVVFHPTNSNILYAGSYASALFYRSTDNGASWTNITSGLPSGQRRLVISVSPDDTSLVYVLVTSTRTFDGMYLSRDNGTTFQTMSTTPNIMDYSTDGSGTGGQAWYDLDMAVDPDNAGIIYVGGVNIFRSDDTGKTWKINAHWVGTKTVPGIHADQHVLEFAPNGNLFIGNDGGIYKTTNGGTTYTDLSKGLGIAQIYRLNQSATNSDMVINGYQDNGTGLLEKGFWHTILGGDGMDCAIDPVDASWSFSALYYGDVRRYKDGYYNGRIAANGTNGINESGAWVTPFVLKEGTSSTMFIGYRNVWRSTNIQDSKTNNIKWTKISSGLAGVNNQVITHLENSIADPEILYVIRADRKLFKSTNVGDSMPSWTDLTSNLPVTGTIRWLESHPRDKNKLWIAHANNKVYESKDGGNTWTDISNGLPNIPITCILFDSSSERSGMYAGSYMGVFYTDTAMGKWVWFNTGMPLSSRVTDLDIYYDSSGRSKSHIVASSYGRGNWRSPLYDETQKPPIAEFNANINSGCIDQEVTFEDVSLNTPTRWLWHITPANVTYLNGTDSFSQDPEVRFLKAGKYTVQLKVENCNGIDSIVKSEVIEIFDGIKTATCSPSTRNTGSNYGIGIHNVIIGAMDNTSTGTFEEGGYVDRGCKEVVELQTDTNYTIIVSTGVKYDEYVKVYIDFNNDGTFNGTNELVWSDGNKKGAHVGSIYIPDTAVKNAIIRMRIVSDYDSLSSNACDSLSYGQAEDFGVRLISKKPIPNFIIDNRLVCANDEITLTDSSIGDNITAYKWVVTHLTGSDTLLGAGPHKYRKDQPGFYTVTLILNDGEAEKSVDSSFNVKPRPDMSIQVKDGKDSFCSGLDLVIQSTDSDSLDNVTNSWYQDGQLLSDADESELAYYPAKEAQNGSYFIITDKDGCKDTSNILDIVIHGNPIVDYDLDTEDECAEYNKFNFTNKTSIADSLGTPLNYNWKFGDGTQSNSTNPSKSYTEAGSYIVTLVSTSQSGCSDSNSVTLEVKPSPVSGFDIEAFDHCIDNNMLKVKDTTLFSESFTTKWDFGDGTTFTGTSTSHSYTSEGLYRITLTSSGANGCSDTFIHEVTIHPQPKANFSINDNQQCLDDHLFNFLNTSTVTTGLITEYKWSTGDGFTFADKDLGDHTYANAGTFQVQLQIWSDAGCQDSITRIVRLGESPVADLTVSLDNPCFNEHLVKVVNTSTIPSGEIANYSWNLGDGRTESGEQISPFQYNESGMYNLTLIAGSDLGCNDSITVPVEIKSSPVLNFDVDIVCEGLETPFLNQSTISSGNITEYSWEFGDGSSSAQTSPVHKYTASGTFDVVLIGSSDQGCADTLTRQNAVVVLERPVADFAYEKLSSWETNTEVKFLDQSSSDVNSWEWTFERTGTEFVQNPTVTFFDTGHYIIQLVAMNEEGCADTATDRIFIFPETNVYIPNTFSPNGDDLNDLFGVKGSVYTQEFQMEVYNRWGERMFNSKDANVQWDGNYKGQTVPAGMYLYTISFIDLEGKKHDFEGTVNVLR